MTKFNEDGAGIIESVFLDSKEKLNSEVATVGIEFEFEESKKQVKKIALFRLEELFTQ